jgi:hypothetical protein
MKRWLSACVLAAPWACSDARLVDGFVEGQTRIRLSPSEFVGELPCRPGTAGALQSYVARLHQVDSSGQVADPPDGGVSTAQTSRLAPCNRAMLFPAVPTQSYAAEILAFDRDIGEGEALTVEPRWRATCGFGDTAGADAGRDMYAPTVAQRGLTVPLRGCTLLGEGAPVQGASRLLVDVPGALGPLQCGQGAGVVGFVEAVLGVSRQSVLCGEPLVVEVAGPARYHTLTLTGFEVSADAGVPAPEAGAPSVAPDASLPEAGVGSDAGLDAAVGTVNGSPPADAAVLDAGIPDIGWVGIPRWRTQCIGRSLPGIVSTATCDPFVPLP